MTYGLTDTGFTAPRAADFLLVIRDEFVSRLSTALGRSVSVDWSADVFLGTTTAIMADMLGGEGEALQSLYDALDPANAAGQFLDNLCTMVGVARNKATYSTVTITCTGTDGTVITEGALMEGGGPNGTTRWRATSDASIAGGTVDVLFQAEEAGGIFAEPDTITTIVTQIAGWSTGTNAAAATPGADREKDATLRRRRQQSLQGGGSTSVAAIRANVLKNDFVQACTVIENTDIAAVTVGGVSIPPIGVAVIVYPSGLTDDQKLALAASIYAKVAAGTSTGGTESSIATGADGTEQTVRWSYSGTTAITVDVTVVLDTGYGLDDVEDAITELVSDYFLSLAVGDIVRHLAILTLIGGVEGVVGADLLLNGAATDVIPDPTDVATLDTLTVTE